MNIKLNKNTCYVEIKLFSASIKPRESYLDYIENKLQNIGIR